MGFFVERNGFTSNTKMWTKIVDDMIANGFTLVSVDGSLSSSLPANKDIAKVVLDATGAVDPLIADQKWRICIECTDIYTKINAATPDQISDVGDITVVGRRIVGTRGTAPVKSGTIGTYVAGAKPPEKLSSLTDDNQDTFFYHKGIVNAALAVSMYGSMMFPLLSKLPAATKVGDISIPPTGPVITAMTDSELVDPRIGVLATTDDAAMPFSYVMSISDHGIAFSSWVESRDNQGCRFNWFVIQRAINSDGTVVKTGKAPLFAMFSSNGGGCQEESAYYPGTYMLDIDGIKRFTVREADVNAPSAPVSAVIHSPDAFAVINPMQQVCLSETGRFDFRLPQGFNSHRHSYPYEIDMIGYGSADVISHHVDLDIQVYNEKNADQTPKLRSYRALNANGANNTGMRVFLLKSGGGV
jgi:hypothetical protein